MASHTSSRARSKTSSIRSSASAKARAAAKRAALETKAASLQRMHELQFEELKLQQRKAELELRTELAVAEAEQKAYEESEIEETRSREGGIGLVMPQQSSQQSDLPSSRPVEFEARVTNQHRDTVPKASSSPDIKPHTAVDLFDHQALNPNAPEWRAATPQRNERSYCQSQSDRFRDESFQALMATQDRQNSVLQQLVEQQQQSVMALTLPQPSMQIFNGDPLNYCDFVRAFEHLVESKAASSGARLYYLVQYTSGSVEELMRSCLSMQPEEGYREARRLLKERFGQKYKIAAAHVQRLIDGPPIKSEDGDELQRFSIQLVSCVNTLNEIGYLGKLDNPNNLKKIVDRLPYPLRARWRDTVDRIVEREERDVTVKDVTEFVTTKARAASHPVFGKLDRERPKDKDPNLGGQRRPRRAANGFATQSAEQASEEGKEKWCPLCKRGHWLSRCERFRKQSLAERRKVVRNYKLCINCLLPGHFVNACPKPSYCKVPECTAKHSTFLHPKAKDEHNYINDVIAPATTASSQDGETDEGPTRANNAYVKMSAKASVPRHHSATALAIVPVRVKAAEGSKTVETYAFLDSGSNTSFCTEALLHQLNLQGRQTSLSLTTIQGENSPVQCSMVSLEVFPLDSAANQVKLPLVYSRPSLPISDDAIGKQEDVNRWPHLHGLSLPEIDAEIGLLIGSDVPEALQPMEVRQSENGGPFATRTILGWVLNGPLGRERKATSSTSNFLQTTVNLEQQFKNYCNLEFNDTSYDPKPSMSQNDKRALRIMEDSVQLKDGHYEIGLPWKSYPPQLENNMSVAERRLSLLKKRLQREPQVHEKYKVFMNDLLKNDYASKVENKDVNQQDIKWYLPHHPVFHPQKPDKVRVVFDCSAKYRQTSLNDQLLQGPDLTNSLVGVLTRFREERVAMMSDIEAMFYQVHVLPSDRKALRFLWWPDGDLDRPAEEYAMKVHLFGGASSPSCANFALRRTAQDNQAEFDPETAATVERNFYVDDCLKSVATDPEAVRLATQLRELLARGGFRLTKWISNSKAVLESLPESERSEQVKDLNLDKSPVERALGVRWSVSSDKFGFSIVVKDRPATRRGILSVVSSVFDPLGFVAPFVLKAKQILQDLCRMKLGWDDLVPNEYLARWQSWLEELPRLEDVEIDRCLKSTSDEEIISIQLHHFSDASQDGYGAVTYLRVEDEAGNVKCSFVMGKSRLAPIKQVTIPRLELSAAVTATRLDKICHGELTLEVSERFFWTDSTCVLRYLENKDKRFQTFVSNRVSTILDASLPSQWHYVNTHANPADDASRGVSATSLDRWIHGPEFLIKPRTAWPQPPSDMKLDIADNDPEVKRDSTTYTNEVSNPHPLNDIIKRFSSWNRLKKVLAWIMRYQAILKRRVKQKKANPTAEIEFSTTIVPVSLTEMINAEKEIIQHVQRACLGEERHCLEKPTKGPKDRRKVTVSRSSHVFKLDPILTGGLLRVGGRLQRAPIDKDARHPIILPKDHHVVELLVNHYHHIAGHSGVEHTLSLIREKYWILNGRSTVKKIIGKCFGCKKRQSTVCNQKMSDLPEDRVTPSQPPFTYTGVDCFGPFEVKRARSRVKRYGVIFTCLSSRAIHLEVAHSLDTESFLNALRRFVARRGQPKEIRSDNGGNFVKGERELREAMNEWNQEQIHNFLLQRNVKWTFNPPAGSHFGGVWERCIRTVRKVMKALMKEQTLYDEGLNTLFCEVESVVNSRPITKLSDDPRDEQPLTPNHLLLLRTEPVLPPGVFGKEDNQNRRRWRQVQYLCDLFWRRWVREYLPLLQQRQKWSTPKKNVAVNDIVLVLDENKPRGVWPLARVLEVYANKRDGLVRAVKVRTSTSELVRPVDKIVLLEEAAMS